MRAFLELGLGGVMASHKRTPLDGYADAVFFGRPALPAAWREHAAPLLEDWTREHPGSRPWAWWRYDAPAPRACLDAAGYVDRGARPGDGGWIWKQEFGLPPHPQSRPPGGAPARMVFESQAEFLRRCALLVPGELARLSAADFKPEVVMIPELAPPVHLGSRRPLPAPALASTNGAHRTPR
ncbi:MAG: hypothetical protein Q7W02_02465 [Candidatus Rokubacteria bacterium]|nr:hypothetical protein [Candidatus Rokubacteria bacterium]